MNRTGRIRSCGGRLDYLVRSTISATPVPCFFFLQKRRRRRGGGGGGGGGRALDPLPSIIVTVTLIDDEARQAVPSQSMNITLEEGGGRPTRASSDQLCVLSDAMQCKPGSILHLPELKGTSAELTLLPFPLIEELARHCTAQTDTTLVVL